MRQSAQRGFVRSGILDLAFLFILILIGIGVWQWLSTIVSGDFMLAWFMVWLMATAAAWWWTREQPLVLRIPAGFLLFLALAVLFAPLSWWSGSKIAVAAEAVVLAVAAKYFGRLWSARFKERVAVGAPWYLDQSINLINDLFLWVGVSIVAWFAVGVLPLLLVLFMPVDWIPWGAMVWGFAATAWYLFKYRKSRVRLLKLPIGLWAFAVTAVVLKLFQQQIAGAMEAGSIELIAYAAYWPVALALFVEIVVLGTHKLLGNRS
jgi:hypothetical protein